ncbi:MAG: TonB-dependent receptor, partial [Deltaproteobacteria bacterium]|nr:TonB-dependent receptor [Deltaproteobacteria bacterium]
GLSYNFKGTLFGKNAAATLGATYSYELEDPRTYFNFSDGTGRTHVSIGRYNETLSIINPAILGEISVDPVDEFSVRLGARYDWISGKYQNLGTNVPIGANVPGPVLESPMYGFFSPKAGLLYRPTPGVDIYADYGRGFTLPAMNGDEGSGFYADNDFNLKVRDQIELGARANITDWLDGEIAIFKIFTKNDNQYDELTERNIPTGTTERHGLELGATIRPHDDWSVDTNYSWTIGKYKKYETSTNVLDGYRMTSFPEHMVNLDLNYHPANLPFGGRVSYHGEFKRLQTNNPPFQKDGVTPNATLRRYGQDYQLLDLMLYCKINENYRLVFNVNNVFNKRYYSGLTYPILSPTYDYPEGDYIYQLRPPRTFYLTFEMNWDKKN